jgi:hypothetical protein
MKTTPFYELSVALRGRSMLFRSIVIVAFAFSVTFSFLGTSQTFLNRSKTPLQARGNPPKVFNADALARTSAR